jgi:hypothetical protein
MPIRNWLKGPATAVLIILAATGLTPARAEIVGTMAVHAMVGELRKDSEALIEKGRQTGEFLIWRTGVEMKQFLDGWERANTALLQKAFSELDQRLQAIFRQMDATLDRLEEGRVDTIEEANNLVDQIAHQIQQIPIIGGNASVSRYSPRVILPSTSASQLEVRLQVFGPQLSSADARLEPQLGSPIPARSPRGTEVTFLIDRQVFPSEEFSHRFVSVPMSFVSNPGSFRPWQQTQRHDLEFYVLPRIAAEIAVGATVEEPVKETRNVAVHLGQFSGRNTRIHRGVNVPEREHGWRLDLARRGEMHLIDGGGDRGRCEGIEDNSVNENGVIMFVRVDNRDRWGRRRDGFVSCSISLPLYRMVPRSREVEVGKLQLGWHQDLALRIPPNTRNVRITARLFDGRVREITGASEDRYFSARIEGDSLIIRPKPPRDM